MNDLRFKIRKISSGWFDVSFVTNGEKLNICASHAWGNDAPRHLLALLDRMTTGETEYGYVVFDDEPGSLVICICKGEPSTLHIVYSELDGDEWKEPLYGDLTQEELGKRIPIESELLTVTGFDFDTFVDSVIAEFDKYASKHKRDKYEGNWMSFPLDELQALKYAAREKE